MRIIRNLFSRTILFFTSLLASDKRFHLVMKLAKDLNEQSLKFIEVKTKNKIPKIKRTTDRFEDLAIIVQGPILDKDQYTFETIKFLLDQYADAKIILSTWSDQNTEQIEQIENSNLIVLKNKLPINRGPNNINLQIFSTVQGIKKAKEYGIKYTIKTRTDQRFYSDSVYNYCKSLIESFPLGVEASKQMNSRLVACSFTTLKYRPYGLGDMFMFGETNDMLKYWDLPLSNAQLIEPNTNTTVIEHAKLRFAEVYITTEFIKKINRSIHWTLKDTWDFYTEYFTIVDHDSIKLQWYKYDSWKADRFDYEQDHTFQIARFNDWLCSYLSKEPPIHIPEEIILNSPFGGLITEKQ
jgi:hypothetical protein